MKKMAKNVLAGILAAATAFSSIALPKAFAEDLVFGDLNNDGVFNERDVADGLQLFAETLTHCKDLHSDEPRAFQIKVLNDTYGYGEAEAAKVIDSYSVVTSYSDGSGAEHKANYIIPEDATSMIQYAYVKENNPEYVYKDYKTTGSDFSQLLKSKNIKNSEFINKYNKLLENKDFDFEIAACHPGDVNGDGKVTAEDATSILESYAEHICDSQAPFDDASTVELFNSDYNCDDVISSEDATGVLIQFAEEIVE